METGVAKSSEFMIAERIGTVESHICTLKNVLYVPELGLYF